MADEGHVISGRRRRGSRLRAAFSALLLAAGCLTAIVVSALVVAPVAAQAGTAPPPPTGWSTVFSDNFAGTAGSAPSAANWFYDIGTGYGTGEIENTTNSTSNVYLDGNGDLVLKAIDNGGTWTSGRIESTRDDFGAPAGGELEMTASIEQPNPANGLGYWPAFWALGSPRRTGGSWPSRGRDRHDGGRQRAQRGLPDPARLGQQPRSRADRLPHHPLPDRLQHLLGDHQPDQHQRRNPRVPDGRGRRGHHHRGVGRHHRLAGRHRPRFLHHLRPGHGRQLPGRDMRRARPRRQPPRPARR